MSSEACYTLTNQIVDLLRQVRSLNNMKTVNLNRLDPSVLS